MSQEPLSSETPFGGTLYILAWLALAQSAYKG